MLVRNRIETNLQRRKLQFDSCQPSTHLSMVQICIFQVQSGHNWNPIFNLIGNNLNLSDWTIRFDIPTSHVHWMGMCSTPRQPRQSTTPSTRISSRASTLPIDRTSWTFSTKQHFHLRENLFFKLVISKGRWRFPVWDSWFDHRRVQFYFTPSNKWAPNENAMASPPGCAL